MIAIIFAAGLGTRLKPLTDTMPKALVPLAGKPLLQWQVERLRDAGITDIIVNVHHFPDMIIDTIRQNDGWGCHITVSDERDLLLDTGGGLRKAKYEIINHKSQMASDPILACNVDILSNIDLRAFIATYENHKSQIINQKSPLGLLVVSDRPTQRYLCFDSENNLCGWTNISTGQLRGCDGRHLAFSGMQILSPEVLALLSQMPADKFSLIDFYMAICEKQIKNPKSEIINPKSEIINLKAYIPDAFRMMDVGKIDQIDQAEAFAANL